MCAENATMIPFQDMFENGKPGIVFKTIILDNFRETINPFR